MSKGKQVHDIDGFAAPEIGARLKLIRQARDWTQPFIAERCGMSSQAWNNNECGRDRISLPAAIKLCQVTGVTLDYIYQGNRRSLPRDVAAELFMVVEAKAPRPVSHVDRRRRGPDAPKSSPPARAKAATRSAPRRGRKASALLTEVPDA